MIGSKKFEELKRGLKWRFIGKENYGKLWNQDNSDWYQKIHDSNYLIHENFKKYLVSKSDVESVLEVGCGSGIYPIKNRNLFDGKNYTGLDISSEAIHLCKQNSNFEFICGDIIKMNSKKKYDLVFSHAVVDHVYDIDTFVTKLLDATKKYLYLNSYRGYFPDLKRHKQNWFENEGIYYNDISVPQIKKLLLNYGLQNNEFNINSLNSGQTDKNVDVQLVIEVIKAE